MKEVKSSKVAKGIIKDDVGDLFPRLMLVRMASIERYIVDNGLTYTFDAFFDTASDNTPSAIFTVQSAEDEKNEITISLSDLRTIEFYGVTRCVDIYCEDDILHALASADADDGMDLAYLSARVEKYDEELIGITPVFRLPVAPHDSEVPVMESLIPALLEDQEKFLDATGEFEDMYDPEACEEMDDLQDGHESPGESVGRSVGPAKAENESEKAGESGTVSGTED